MYLGLALTEPWHAAQSHGVDIAEAGLMSNIIPFHIPIFFYIMYLMSLLKYEFLSTVFTKLQK